MAQKALIVNYDLTDNTTTLVDVNKLLSEGWFVVSATPMGGVRGEHCYKPFFASLVILQNNKLEQEAL